MKVSPRYDGTPILVIPGAAAEIGVAVSRQRRRMEALLAGLGDDDWAHPSRCDAWTVHDVIAHLVGVNAFWQASVVAGIGGAPTRMLAGFDPAAHPAQMVAPMRALSRQALLDQFVASNDGFLGVLESLDEPGWAAIAESPAGHVNLRLLAMHALWDAWVHERDIALPLGASPAEEPDEVAQCLEYAAAIGPALTITADTGYAGRAGVVADDPAVRFTLEVGESVVVHHGDPPAGTPCLHGDAVALVEGLSIRAPLPTDTPDEWRRLVHGLATVFDTEPATQA